MKITSILEDKTVFKYLKERLLLKQYQKAKQHILSGNLKTANFKLKKPKEKGIYSFRINKQFRALCIYKEDNLLVFTIDNHQN